MDQDQDISLEESHVNLLTLPTELLVYIISFLFSLRDRVKLRYVSRWLKCVIEGTPLLWREFVWPYYDSREECSVKDLLKMCGQYIKVVSFPNCRIPSRVVKMLQYCSNIERLSLPSNRLSPVQLRKIIHHMECLQILELKVDNSSDMKQLLLHTGHLKELTIFPIYCHQLKELFKHWVELELRPLNFNIITPVIYSNIECLIDYATLTNIPTGTTANFRACNKSSKVPLNFSPTLPYFQLQFEESGQVTTPCVKLSDFVTLGLEDDLAVMTYCQYGGRTVYMVKHNYSNYFANKLSSWYIAKCCNLSCVTRFELSDCPSLQSDHLKQLAIACPNLQVLNLEYCHHCMKSLQGLQAIASYCRNLEGLNILGIRVSELEDHILLWEILSDMKLTHLVVEFCILRLEAANKEKLIGFYQKCWTIRGIQCEFCGCEDYTNEDVSMVSYFSLLHYCYFKSCHKVMPTAAQDVINNCKELQCVQIIFCHRLSLNITHNVNNLQQIYIDSIDTDVPDNFITSVLAYGGLVHVVMRVGSVSVEGVTSLVRNSHKLITLHLCVKAILHVPGYVKTFKDTLKKMFCTRKLFTSGNFMLYQGSGSLSDVLWEQGVDLLPLWNIL
ncbi:F-box and leucine-rich repeat protein 13-like [Dysidea avara]|uniref:F-box and leucine-rich repeat protein 13-like n=1 Tax=Dysidea avara TaxID=196820 RepID=UPI003331B4B0